MGMGRRLRRMIGRRKYKISRPPIPRCLICNRMLLFPARQAKIFSPLLAEIPLDDSDFDDWQEGIRNLYICKRCLK